MQKSATALGLYRPTDCYNDEDIRSAAATAFVVVATLPDATSDTIINSMDASRKNEEQQHRILKTQKMKKHVIDDNNQDGDRDENIDDGEKRREENIFSHSISRQSYFLVRSEFMYDKFVHTYQTIQGEENQEWRETIFLPFLDIRQGIWKERYVSQCESRKKLEEDFFQDVFEKIQKDEEGERLEIYEFGVENYRHVLTTLEPQRLDKVKQQKALLQETLSGKKERYLNRESRNNLINESETIAREERRERGNNLLSEEANDRISVQLQITEEMEEMERTCQLERIFLDEFWREITEMLSGCFKPEERARYLVERGEERDMFRIQYLFDKENERRFWMLHTTGQSVWGEHMSL